MSAAASRAWRPLTSSRRLAPLNPALSYALFESRTRLGGSLASEVLDGTVLERGPDSFLTEKACGHGIGSASLGLGADLIPSNDRDRKTWIAVGNRLVSLPDGLMFLVPTKLLPTALTPLFSLRTKLRMALELLHPPRPSEEDESVAALVERHFGREAVEPAGRSAAFGHLRWRRDAAQRPHRPAAPGGDGGAVRLAFPRHAGRAQEDESGHGWESQRERSGATGGRLKPMGGKRSLERGPARRLHRPARRPPATGGRAGGSARPSGRSSGYACQRLRTHWTAAGGSPQPGTRSFTTRSSWPRPHGLPAHCWRGWIRNLAASSSRSPIPHPSP